MRRRLVPLALVVCGFVASGCSPVLLPGGYCGDGVLNRDNGEDCDQGVPLAASCESLGFVGGTLRCAIASCTYDTSECVASVCGDTIIEAPSEQCEGSNLDGATCQSLGFLRGTVSCDANCRYDTSMCVTTQNAAPTVTAGPDRAITVTASAALEGAVSDDGLPTNQLTVAWSQLEGPGWAHFHQRSQPQTTAFFSVAGTYLLQLAASDGLLNSSDTVTVIVSPEPPENRPPTVSAGADQTIALPASAILVGTASDDGQPDGTLTTTWSRVSGPGTVTFGNASALNTSATFSVAGTYVLRLTASDGPLNSSDTVTVIVSPENQAPTVRAWPDQTIVLPAAAILVGAASDDGLPDGALTTTWSRVSGPGTVTFGNASALNTSATFSVAGTYVLRLTASDSALTGTDDLTVTASPGCGNNVAEGNERCDGTDLNGLSCSSLGLFGDQDDLSCRNCQPDTFLCVGCGNGRADGLEACDGTNRLVNCADLGWSGNATCNAQCAVDFASCGGRTDFCQANGDYNNGVCDPCHLLGGMRDPDCDTHCGANGTCASYFDVYSGRYTCELTHNQHDPDCGCGNGQLRAPDPSGVQFELCDGTLFQPGFTCVDMGYLSGTVRCQQCKIDVSDCRY